MLVSMDTNPLSKFNQLTVWKKGDQRAPHKPLLVLWAIGRCLEGRERLILYEEIHEDLRVLLQRFAPPRDDPRTHDPFWWLQRDGVWDVIADVDPLPRRPGRSVVPTVLLRHAARGGFPAAIHDIFCANVNKALEVAQSLLEQHFPKTWHQAILEATIGPAVPMMSPEERVGGDSPLLMSIKARRERDRQFRDRILSTYDHRCAVCGYSLEFPPGYWPALEAAHIKWHSHKGPDAAANGLSLCVIHHELFDWGVFAIQPDTLVIHVADKLRGQDSGNSVTELHNSQLQFVPRHPADRPAAQYLDWHRENVFAR